MVRADKLVVMCRKDDLTISSGLFAPLHDFQNDRRCQLVVKIIQVTNIRLEVVQNFSQLHPCFLAVDGLDRVGQLAQFTAAVEVHVTCVSIDPVVIGMSICSFNVQLKGRKIQGTIFGLLFVILSIVVYTAKISGSAISFAIGLLACVAVIMMVAGFEEKFGRGMKLLAKYTMPIFLMHTLFAAPLRSILMKIGIENAVIHVVLGLVISFAGPIIAAWIMKKTKWLEFFLYPNKFVKVNVILLNKASKKYL